MSPSIIDAYAAGPQLLAGAIQGLSDAELRRNPPAELNIGLWSIHQILVHLADAESVLANRMKWVIAEENPPLPAFDETRWASQLGYDEQSAEDALALITLIRRQMARVLRTLPAEAFARFGTHSETGQKTLSDLVQMATRHLDHHLAFVPKKRAWLGK